MSIYCIVMNDSDLCTEQVILEAAESEFLEKGYGNAKMMAIAKRANVAHSMLHYYFRNKENLFQKVFLAKSLTLLPLFEDVFDQHLSFFDTIKLLIETQFDFLVRNPKLPFFIATEILSNKENQKLLFEVLAPRAKSTLSKIAKALKEEIAKGTIRSISTQNLIINMASINIITFIALPIIQDIIECK